jgi:hypothetical protein
MNEKLQKLYRVRDSGEIGVERNRSFSRLSTGKQATSPPEWREISTTQWTTHLSSLSSDNRRPSSRVDAQLTSWKNKKTLSRDPELQHNSMPTVNLDRAEFFKRLGKEYCELCASSNEAKRATNEFDGLKQLSRTLMNSCSSMD